LKTTIFVGGLLIDKGNILLKERGEAPREWLRPPGKHLEGDETLEMAVSKGFKEETGWMCAVRDLVYVIESFKGDGERELGVYFLVSVPSPKVREVVGPGLRFVSVKEMITMDVRPAVLAGKIFADEKRGLRGSATYLVNHWND
jgi:ADP-ribose pyrophosphatase YjhB (NUDIX family)